MYQNVPPKLKILETISNPTEPAEVFGFRARNMMMGIASIVMKETATAIGFASEVVQIPEEAAEEIATDNGELIVLYQDEVLAMSGRDFEKNTTSATFGGGGSTSGMVEVRLDSDDFRAFDRDEVEVGSGD